MLQLGPIAFANPWLLTALVTLPLIWLLIRAIPPSAKQQIFPAIRLLKQMDDMEPPSGSTPWWLMLLRLLIAALLIFALAEPIFNPKEPLSGDGPVVLVVDNGWTAANKWTQRQDAAIALLDEAERQDRTAIIIPTAAPAGGWKDGDETQILSPMPAREAKNRVRALEPTPWPSDLNILANWLDDGEAGDWTLFRLSDGIGHEGEDRFLDRLNNAPSHHVIASENNLIAFHQLKLDGLDFEISLVRAQTTGPQIAIVEALSANGRLLGQVDVEFQAGASYAQGQLMVPPNVRSNIARLNVSGQAHAGASYLLDSSSLRPLVGLVDSDTAETRQPLRSARFYLSRALSPFSILKQGDALSLLDQDVSVLILGDSARLAEAEEEAILNWIEDGGVFLRFAGPKLGSQDRINIDDDPLLPVTLRLGERAVGGALSWSTPQKLGAFPDYGPFINLNPSKDVTINRQVLAQPDIELSSKTWARLEDDTPLVTAKRQGRGHIILVHTTATPDWSDLALSGTFVDMLRRILTLAQAVPASGDTPSRILQAERHLDGFGRLRTPFDNTAGLDPRERIPTSNASLPPGLYGAGSYNMALNLTAPRGPIDPRFIFEGPSDALNALPSRPLEAGDERPLHTPFFTIALLLLVLDVFISMALRGHLKPVIGALLLISFTPTPESKAQPFDDTAKGAANVQLGCMESGNSRVDQICMEGLTGLSLALRRRTSVWPGEPVLLRPDNPNLGLYPLLYWPVLEDARALTDTEVSNVTQYLQRSGLIIFDTGTGVDQNNRLPQDSVEIRAALNLLLGRLNLPPLELLNSEHVLSHSFYILDRYPGRLLGRPTWVEQGTQGESGRVSTLIIGGNDWVSQWTLGRRSLTNTTRNPSVSRQKELALRFGINATMYALTGTYKSDQVHLPALIDRVGR